MIDRRLYRVLFLQTLCLFLIPLTQAVADTPAPPKDFEKVTENKAYVFVMLAPEGWGDHDAEVRRVYKQSGLYRNDGSSTPIWTVDWYSFSVIPVSDGKHLIRFGPWASSTSELALAFYRNGSEIKNYKIKELVRDESKLTYTVSHFFWKSEVDYNEKGGVLFLRTRDGQEYNFSITTGAIQPKPKDSEAR